MSTHTNPRKDMARQIAREQGYSVRTAYRRINDACKRKENEAFDYDSECPKGAWV